MYTQSPADNVVDELQPFLKHGGEIVRLENAGRESHVYLQHISRNYHQLANHTLFTQDAPNIDLLPKKFEASPCSNISVTLSDNGKWAFGVYLITYTYPITLGRLCH